MRWFRAQHFTSAEECIEQEKRSQDKSHVKAHQQQGNLYAWGRWLKMRSAHNADVPVVLPSQWTPLWGIEYQETEHKAIPKPVDKHAYREWLSQLDTQPLPSDELPIEKQETGPMPKVSPGKRFYSVRRGIWADQPTQKHKAVRPRLTVQDDPSKQRGLRKRGA